MTRGRLLDLVRQEVDPYNTPTPKFDSTLFTIFKLSQIKAAVLFPASKLYSLRTVGYLPYTI